MELMAETRGELLPDPLMDPILSVAFSLGSESDSVPAFSCLISVVHTPNYSEFVKGSGSLRWSEMIFVNTEEELIEELLAQITKHDPDVLLGYDVQRSSWGYLLERANTLNLDLCPKLSRIPGVKRQSEFSTEDRWWSLSDVQIAGRIVLNLWRVLRHELPLNSYSFENTVFHLLHLRVPYYPHQALSRMIHSKEHRAKVFDYLKFRVDAEFQILVHCDILNRTTEMAKLYGIQFFDVLTRGTQFRVESMMFRMTKKANFAALSPSVNQRNGMRAPECIALTMEPESGFYKDPVLVLDFQSLYPSMCIAYNYCYSTCLGNITKYSNDEEMKFGCDKLRLSPELLRDLEKDIHISPAGVGFVKSHIRRGIIPQMLEEILNTRIMVKNCMKKYKGNKSLLKVLDARQLALKLIANVTYGYTSANFSGRMPCVEVADSIVHKGRETLERAIHLVNNHPTWNGRVIYGDTDSLFVLLNQRSKAEAFHIGNQIAAAVTELNPSPVKLKFEKVYYPCVLESKKRYVGFSLESAEQAVPVFDAKGIETVRRDTCPAVVKILEKSLRILFERRGDVEGVKRYLASQFGRIQDGKVGIENFILAKEYRGRMGYRPGARVPALEIAKKRCEVDKRSEPRMKERVPYVIIAGPPKTTLLSCVKEPEEFLRNPSFRLNYDYYIRGQIIPALNRVFLPMGQDVKIWHAHMPRIRAKGPCFIGGLEYEGDEEARPPGTHRTMSQFFKGNECLICGEPTLAGVCFQCKRDPQTTLTLAGKRIKEIERRFQDTVLICGFCVGLGGCRDFGDIPCQSIDCPIYMRRLSFLKEKKRAQRTSVVLRSLPVS